MNIAGGFIERKDGADYLATLCEAILVGNTLRSRYACGEK